MPELNIIGAKEENRFFPYQSAFRVTRQSFWQAGQDSFTNPPAQNPDMFQALTNIEPVTTGNLKRRRGYALFANTAPASSFNEGYAFRSETQNLRRLVWTSPTTVTVTDEAGNILLTPLFTPALTASTVRMVLSRSYGYFADGAQVDYQKWDGTLVSGNLTNWGININATPASTYGPNAPGTAAEVSPGIAGEPWANPNNIKVDDGVYSTTTLTATDPPAPFYYSNRLQGTNFGFSVSPATATITGIALDIKGLQAPVDGNVQIIAYLMKGGVIVGSRKTFFLAGTDSFVTLGGPSDSWGVPLQGSDVNDSGFGFSIQAEAFTGAAVPVTLSIDYAQITVYISGSTITLGSPSGTGITLISGRLYTVVFQNSTAGTTSGLYPFSTSTGPLSNQGQPLSGLPVSSDPQVDTKLLLATADGGDETTLYVITQLLNATTTYTDIMPDSQLLLQSIYQETDVNGNLHGVANNNPPPLINFPTKHKGRIFGVVGPTLFFSKNLDDVTTSTGTITGKWEEAWPATYSLDVSELAETVTGLLSDGQTLYIGTDHSIRRLVGDSPDNFQEPEVIFNEAGLINQEVWKIVFMEGQPVGTMWMTPDYRVMFSDFNTYQDIGTPIQDVLNTINTSVAQTVSHACFVSKGPSEYFMLYLATGINTLPDTVCVYNLRTKKWVIWNPTDRVTASLYNIDVTGIPQWLFSTQTGPLYQWTDAVRVDRSGNTPVFYAASGKTSWLDFGDMGLTKAFNKIIVTTADPLLTVGVQGAIRDSDLDTGGKIVISATPLQQEIFGDLFVPMVGQDGFYKWYQVEFISPASSIVDVIDGFDFEIMPSMRM